MGEQHDDDRDGSSNRGRDIADEAAETTAMLRAFSHDVATPLANITLAAEVLTSAAGRLSEDRLEGLGRNVSTEAHRLRRMINTLIEWNQLGSGNRQLHTEWHLVEDLVGSALRGLDALLDDQKVVVTIEPDMAFVRGDDVLIESALSNLIDNAASCTAKGEEIKIIARADDTGCTFEVLDAGPRLENEEDMPVDARCSARAGHTGAPGGGLGLDVSRMIVEAHDGEIWARNRSEEPGAVFAFVLGYGGESPPHAPIEAPMGDDGTE